MDASTVGYPICLSGSTILAPPHTEANSALQPRSAHSPETLERNATRVRSLPAVGSDADWAIPFDPLQPRVTPSALFLVTVHSSLPPLLPLINPSGRLFPGLGRAIQSSSSTISRFAPLQHTALIEYLQQGSATFAHQGERMGDGSQPRSYPHPDPLPLRGFRSNIRRRDATDKL